MTVATMAVNTHPYTLNDVRGMSGLSRHAVARLVELGFIHPQAADRGYRYSFQDAVLLRSASELRAANIPTRRILEALKRLRETLPSSAEASSLRITSESGVRVAVRAGNLQWEPATGQLTLDLQVQQGGDVQPLGNTKNDAPLPLETNPESTFLQAEALEDEHPEAAERMYLVLLESEPDHAHAYLNLGFMLCEQKRFKDAVTLYAKACLHCHDDPLVHFNHAVALEALDRVDQALTAYECSLSLDPELLDAHQNAALLYAQIGQQQMAIRHFSAYKRLTSKKR